MGADVAGAGAEAAATASSAKRSPPSLDIKTESASAVMHVSDSLLYTASLSGPSKSSSIASLPPGAEKVRGNAAGGECLQEATCDAGSVAGHAPAIDEETEFGLESDAKAYSAEASASPKPAPTYKSLGTSSSQSGEQTKDLDVTQVRSASAMQNRQAEFCSSRSERQHLLPLPRCCTVGEGTGGTAVTPVASTTGASPIVARDLEAAFDAVEAVDCSTPHDSTIVAQVGMGIHLESTIGSCTAIQNISPSALSGLSPHWSTTLNGQSGAQNSGPERVEDVLGEPRASTDSGCDGTLATCSSTEECVVAHHPPPCRSLRGFVQSAVRDRQKELKDASSDATSADALNVRTQVEQTSPEPEAIHWIVSTTEVFSPGGEPGPPEHLSPRSPREHGCADSKRLRQAHAACVASGESIEEHGGHHSDRDVLERREVLSKSELAALMLQVQDVDHMPRVDTRAQDVFLAARRRRARQRLVAEGLLAPIIRLSRDLMADGMLQLGIHSPLTFTSSQTHTGGHPSSASRSVDPELLSLHCGAILSSAPKPNAEENILPVLHEQRKGVSNASLANSSVSDFRAGESGDSTDRNLLLLHCGAVLAAQSCQPDENQASSGMRRESRPTTPLAAIVTPKNAERGGSFVRSVSPNASQSLDRDLVSFHCGAVLASASRREPPPDFPAELACGAFEQPIGPLSPAARGSNVGTPEHVARESLSATPPKQDAPSLLASTKRQSLGRVLQEYALAEREAAVRCMQAHARGYLVRAQMQHLRHDELQTRILRPSNGCRADLPVSEHDLPNPYIAGNGGIANRNEASIGCARRLPSVPRLRMEVVHNRMREAAAAVETAHAKAVVPAELATLPLWGAAELDNVTGNEGCRAAPVATRPYSTKSAFFAKQSTSQILYVSNNGSLGANASPPVRRGSTGNGRRMCKQHAPLQRGASAAVAAGSRRQQPSQASAQVTSCRRPGRLPAGPSKSPPSARARSGRRRNISPTQEQLKKGAAGMITSAAETSAEKHLVDAAAASAYAWPPMSAAGFGLRQRHSSGDGAVRGRRVNR